MWAIFDKHLRITGLQGKGEGISLTPRYHFLPLHRHLAITLARLVIIHYFSILLWYNVFLAKDEQIYQNC